MDNTKVQSDNRNSTFIMVYEDVWQALRGDPPALAVYMALFRRTHDGNRSWYGTKKAMSDEAGVSVATFERKVKILEEHGLVHVTRQYRDPKNNKISTTKGDGFTEQIQNVYTVRERTTDWYERIAESVGVTSERGGVASLRGDMSPHGEVGVTSERGANIDPLHTSQTQIPNLCSSVDEPGSADAFGRFWDVYPRKKGDKRKIRTKFNEKAEEVGADALINAAKNFADECKRQQTALIYIVYPSTWLNQNRWKDYLTAPKPRPAEADVDEITNWDITTILAERKTNAS